MQMTSFGKVSGGLGRKMEVKSAFNSPTGACLNLGIVPVLRESGTRRSGVRFLLKRDFHQILDSSWGGDCKGCENAPNAN